MMQTFLNSMYYSALWKKKRDVCSFKKKIASQISQKVSPSVCVLLKRDYNFANKTYTCKIFRECFKLTRFVSFSSGF